LRTSIADIYLTEFDRIFRHFYARDAINRFAQHGSQDNPLLLDTTDQWIAPNFKPGSYKNNRRLLFFPDSGTQPKPWSQKASADPNPFANEQQLAKQNRQRKKEPAKKTRARKKAPAEKTPAKKKVAKKLHT